MESLSLNIYKSKISPEKLHWVDNHTTVFVCYQQKIIKFLVFSSWKIFRLTLSFCWWCWSLCFHLFDELLDTINLLSSSVRKLLLEYVSFYLELFHYLIDSIHHLFHIYYLMSHKNSQLYHILIGKHLILFIERKVMFLTTTYYSNCANSYIQWQFSHFPSTS